MPHSVSRSSTWSATSSAISVPPFCLRPVSRVLARPARRQSFGLRGSCLGGTWRNAQSEHVRAVIVAGRVEPLPLLVEPRRVELGVKDPFLVVEWACEVAAVGREDRTAAAADHVDAVEELSERKVV